MKTAIYFTERNIHGAIVIYGILGVKQYYGYTAAEAKKKYKDEANSNVFTNQR